MFSMWGGARRLKSPRKSLNEKLGRKVPGGVGGYFARGVRQFWGWNCHFTSCSGTCEGVTNPRVYVAVAIVVAIVVAT